MMSRKRWTIREEPFRLTDEEGNEIRLPYRKVQEVFLAIAKAASVGITRERLGRICWPDLLSEARQVNLRQILFQLRRTLGEGRIIADRNRCSLSSEIAVLFETGAKSEASSESPVQSFFQFLDWQSQTQPSQMFEMMRLNYQLSEALTPPQRARLIEQATMRLEPGDSAFIWSEYWKASILSQSHGVRSSIPLYRQAVKKGIEFGDPLLVGTAATKWALSEILLGRPESAMLIADRGINDSKVSTPDRRLGLSIIRPVALIHMGRTKEGMDELYRLEASTDFDEISGHQFNSLLAVFEATNGQYDSALNRIHAPKQAAKKLGDRGLEVLCTFTSAFVDSRVDPLNAIPRLIELRDFCTTANFGHIALYTDESLAHAYKLVREQSQAKRLALKSAKDRMSMGFHSTEWDRSRNQQLTAL